MAPRGRPRKPSANLPAHIDVERLPRGIYWDKTGSGRWFVFEHVAGSKRKARTVAQSCATMAELHAIAEARAGIDRNTLRGLLDAYRLSPEFRRLAKATRDDYTLCCARVLEQRTKIGGTLGDLQTRRITRPLIQVLIDRIAAGRKRDDSGELIPTPSTGAHVLRYLRAAFRWGANRGYCAEINPAQGVEPPKERKRRRLPTHDTYAAVIQFAREQGLGRRGHEGSVAPYLWAIAEIAYLCRLRSIEVVCDLTDAHITDAGLVCIRRKGSLTTVTRWDDRLRAAHDALLDYRRRIWDKRKHPTPMRPEDRPLVVGTSGQALTKTTFNSAWQRMIRAAIAQEVITPDQRFSMHDLKRRGVTDTAGNRSDKQQASGHRNQAMLDVYDHDIPTVDSAASSLLKKPRQP